VFLIFLIPVYLVYIFVKFGEDQATNILVSGFAQGAFYALIAVGFSIIFGVARMFKLSLGGYFVLGAYFAFWLNKVVSMPVNTIQNDGISNLTELTNTVIIYTPLVLFIAVLGFYMRYLGYKLGGGLVLVNLVLFVVYRAIMVNEYSRFNFAASFNAFLILAGILTGGLGLIYLELSKKQVLISMGVLHLLSILLTFDDQFIIAPGVYIAILIFSVMMVAVSSMLVDRYLLDKARGNPTNVLIITFGIALLIQSLIPLFKFPQDKEYIKFGIEDRNLSGIVAVFDNYVIFGHPIQALRIVAAIMAVVLLILVYIFINYTPMGKAMEAVSEDPDAAWPVGINVRKVYLVATGLGMGLAAAAGVLTSPFAASPAWGVYMGWTPLIFAIAVVTLGGIGSIFGSAIAGFIIGYTEVTISSQNIQLSRVVPLLVIFIIMLLRPDGLFGREEDEE
jgi:branched-chain amino acid transport system permease protein